MTDDLVKRVRDNFIDPKTVPWSFKSPNILLYKLADRIEALTAERDEYKRIADHSEDVVRAARAEIERLKQEAAWYAAIARVAQKDNSHE